ncbi:MAG TPA: sigma-70 family RNA polymerase sigma factor [Acidimicrobiales bacterium]|nr:sigma-70 family RNA polymerase sigma factor [Acidimicrobiales bacterium]
MAAEDEAVAARTIPRGRGPEDPDRSPGIDPEVWLDHVRLARHRDPAALARLARAYDRYAHGLARKVHRHHRSSEDVDQVALEALVQALLRFDPERGVPFPAFATPHILGAVRRYYRDHGSMIRMPRGAQDVAAAEQAAVGRFVASTGRTPTPAEVAAELGIGVDLLIEVHLALQARTTVSIEAATADDRPLDEALGRLDGGFALAEDLLALTRAVEPLDDTERDLLHRYFFQVQSQAEIARSLGISQMQVSRLLAGIVRRLRVAMATPSFARATFDPPVPRGRGAPPA